MLDNFGLTKILFLLKDPASSASTSVVTRLEEESKAPRNGTMKMPKEKVKWIEYLLVTYGEDYEVTC